MQTQLSTIGIAAGGVALFAALYAGPPAPDVKMEDAAQVGDVVSVKLVTPICKSANDSFAVYYAGVQATLEEIRLGGDVWKAVRAADDARKAALVTAYSCHVTIDDTPRYRVTQKRITGTADDPFMHVVAYCLQPEGNDDGCYWTEDEYGRDASIVKANYAGPPPTNNDAPLFKPGDVIEMVKDPGIACDDGKDHLLRAITTDRAWMSHPLGVCDYVTHGGVDSWPWPFVILKVADGAGEYAHVYCVNILFKEGDPVNNADCDWTAFPQARLSLCKAGPIPPVPRKAPGPDGDYDVRPIPRLSCMGQP